MLKIKINNSQNISYGMLYRPKYCHRCEFGAKQTHKH